MGLRKRKKQNFLTVVLITVILVLALILLAGIFIFFRIKAAQTAADKDGLYVGQHSYEEEKLPDNLSAEGMNKEKIEISGQKVDAWTNKILSEKGFYIVYLKNSRGEADFYIYDEQENALQRAAASIVSNKKEENGQGEDTLRVQIIEIALAVFVFACLFGIALMIGPGYRGRLRIKPEKANEAAYRIDHSYGDKLVTEVIAQEMKPEIKKTENLIKPPVSEKPKIPKLIGASSAGQAIVFMWEKSEDADGYIVIRKEEGREWRRVKRIENRDTTFYRDIYIKKDVCYVYTIRAYKNAGGKMTEGDMDGIGVTVTAPLGNIPDSPRMADIESIRDVVKVYWERIKGADGYIVIRKTDDGKFERVKRIHHEEENFYIDKAVTKGHEYTYTVRAFKYVGDASADSEYDSEGISIRL